MDTDTPELHSSKNCPLLKARSHPRMITIKIAITIEILASTPIDKNIQMLHKQVAVMSSAALNA